MADHALFPDLERLTAELPAIIDQSMRETIPAHYTPEAAKAVSDTMLGMLTGRLCPVWPTLCTDTTPGHYDHFNHQHAVTDKRGETLLDVTFTQFSDEDGDNPPKVSLGGMTSEDYDPSEVREATAKVRRLLDEADEMADKVLRMQGTAVLSPSERAFTRARLAIDAAVEASADPKGTALALRTYADMTGDELTTPARGDR